VEEEEDVHGRAFGGGHDVEGDVLGEVLSGWEAWRSH
jgi:hypothetical protein